MFAPHPPNIRQKPPNLVYWIFIHYRQIYFWVGFVRRVLALSGCVLVLSGCVLALSGCVLALSGCILALSGCVLVGLAITLFKLYTNFVCLFSSLQPCRMNINPTKGLYHYTSLLTTLKSHSLCNTEAIQHFRLRYWHAFCRSRYPVFFSGLELFHIDIVRVSRVSLLSGTQPAILVSL